MSWETLVFITVLLLVLVLFIDIWKPFSFFTEGFASGPGSNQFMIMYFPRRGDISFGTDETTYEQDNRHVMGYTDVQGLGVNHDFCRMIVPKGTKGTSVQSEENMFFACALAGTENLTSTSFRTPSVKDGFQTSRDDYMRDADKDGRSDYCAVVRVKNGSFQAQCYRALTTTFDTKQFVDTEPPEDIAEVLYFYEGIMFWFRFIDDMKDYAENLTTFTAGSLSIDEVNVKVLPSQIMEGNKNDTTDLNDRVQVTRGLKFNGVDQFIRLGDSPDMSFGSVISLPVMKSLCFWVYFDEFTNNAHIIDFGNGAGIDNIFLGIVGRGDPSIADGSLIRKSPCENSDFNNVLPDKPSGPQPVPDMSPQELMLSTANVDEYIYKSNAQPRDLPTLKPFKKDNAQQQEQVQAEYATLIWEVWNGKLRMEHINVLKAFRLRKWTHCCITTTSNDSVRPGLQIWIDGIKMAEKDGTHMPQVSITNNNYLGKNNWLSDSSQYENKPELFRGNLFDVRGYKLPMGEVKLKKTIEWGKKRLGI
jgi:hypothetical protein